MEFDLIVETDNGRVGLGCHRLELKGLAWPEAVPPDVVQTAGGLVLVKEAVEPGLTTPSRYRYRVATVAIVIGGALRRLDLPS